VASDRVSTRAGAPREETGARENDQVRAASVTYRRQKDYKFNGDYAGLIN
jgi:hypothetical protein